MSGAHPTGSAGRWVAILLAAGRSSRMGRSKTRLPWEGTSLLEYQIASLATAGAGRIAVVVPPADQDLVGPQAVAVPNPDPELGKTHSLRLGLAALFPSPGHPESGEAILLIAVDQPRPASLLSSLVDAHFQLGREITLPRYRGRRGHPAVLSSALRSELSTASEETEGLRGIVRRNRTRVAEWETDDPSVVVDLNDPGDYESALRSLRS